MVMRVLILLPLALCAMMFTGCDLLDPGFCTQIGCVDGLTVVLEDPPDVAFTVTLVAGGETVNSFECTAGSCAEIFFEGVGVPEVTVVVEYGETVRSETFTPSYTRVQPNGRNCPPICFTASVRLTA